MSEQPPVQEKAEEKVEEKDDDFVLVNCENIPHRCTNRIFVDFKKPLFSDLEKSFFKQIRLNPLLITDFKDKLDSTFKSEHPNMFCWFLTLGTSIEEIKYANYILFKVFANGYRICDPDLLFMAIWYHFSISNPALSERFEDQLRVRFGKDSPLGMSTNLLENQLRDEKWCCVWYILHELPLVKQDDIKHCSIMKWISKSHVLVKFLQEIFYITVDANIVRYLEEYAAFSSLRRFKNRLASEFRRMIIAMYNDCIFIDLEKIGSDMHGCYFKDLDFKASSGTVDLSTGKINTREDDFCRVSCITIPIDGCDGYEKIILPYYCLRFMFYRPCCRSTDHGTATHGYAAAGHGAATSPAGLYASATTGRRRPALLPALCR